MGKKASGIVSAVIFLVMTAATPIISNLSMSAHAGTDPEMNMSQDCDHGSNDEDGAPASKKGVGDPLACCSVLCQGFLMSAPQLVPSLAMIQDGIAPYYHLVLSGEPDTLYHPPKA